MVFLVLLFTLVLQTKSYLESLNINELTSAEACFDAKVLTPTLNCTAKSLATLTTLKMALTEITSVHKTVDKKLIPGIATGLLNLFASHYDGNLLYGPEKGRMNSDGSWCSGNYELGILFFQIGSSLPFEFHGIEVKDILLSNNRITSISVYYSTNGINWASYNSGEILVMPSTFSRFSFKPFVARTIRIYIQKSSPNLILDNICAKFEAFVKPLANNQILGPDMIIAALSSGFRFRYSSVDPDHLYSITHFDYSYDSKWCAQFPRQGEWASVGSAVKMRWKSIKLAPNAGGRRLFNIKLAYSDDGITWNWYNNGQEFVGIDGNSAKTTQLNPFDARVIRIYPTTWDGYPCTKLEAYCSEIEQV